MVTKSFQDCERDRIPGRAGEGINDEELSSELYRILMSFDDDAEIDGVAFAEQWGVPGETVASIVTGAKRMSPDGKIAKELAAIAFTVDEFT